MMDLLYIALTIVFFAIMLAYIEGCELLGRERSYRSDLP